jgi:hypothetical protein
MAAKELKRLDANGTLGQSILEAIKKAHEGGLSTDDVKATLQRYLDILEEE